ncbi:MAG TPA: hypothetical protein VNL14_22100 [Candidatus Acidoferrales bacterium]|nr:hypothetical protein [Candidatus Acidoferrales bacterium]
MAGINLLVHVKLLFIAMLLFGCATTAAVELKPTIDNLPTISKIPLSVRTYYSRELRSYMYESVHMYASVHWLPLCQGIVLPLGQASVTLFERLFPIIFHSAVTLEAPPAILPGKEQPSIIIEPDIEEVQCARSAQAKHVEITYHFSLYTPGGEALGYWNVTGRGEAKDGFFEDPNTTAGRAADLAMEDAARKIAIEFKDIPAVRRLLQEPTPQSDPKQT